MVMDGYGYGCTVGYCFVANERRDTVMVAIRTFVDHNKAALTKTRTIVVGKDYNKISSISEIMPEVATHLCRYHVASV